MTTSEKRFFISQCFSTVNTVLLLQHVAKKLSAFSILNSYNIYRLFPITHADTYTLTDTQVHISLSLAM